MKLNHVVVGIVMLMAGIASAGESLLKWADSQETLKKQWNGKYKIEKIDGAPGNGLCVIVDKNTSVESAKYIPVDAAKKYILSGNFKSNGKELSKFYFGFKTYDAKKKYIASLHANTIPGTDTELTAAAKKGDKFVLIKSKNKWRINTRTGGTYGIAFNTKNDFSDLPNREYQYGLVKITAEGNAFKVELKKALTKDYPAGTKIREHTTSYGSFVYTAASGDKIPKEWKEYKGAISLAKPGQMGLNFFRPGTAFVKIIILANYHQKADVELEMTNIEFKETE